MTQPDATPTEADDQATANTDADLDPRPVDGSDLDADGTTPATEDTDRPGPAA
jgi:hypothetical protein